MNVFAESDSGGVGRGRISSDGGEVQRRTIPRDLTLALGQQAQREALSALIPRSDNSQRGNSQRGRRRRRRSMPRG